MDCVKVDSACMVGCWTMGSLLPRRTPRFSSTPLETETSWTLGLRFP